MSVAPDGSDVRVERVVTAVDCGMALNPHGVTGQTESAITWGLSAALLGKMDFGPRHNLKGPRGPERAAPTLLIFVSSEEFTERRCRR